MKTSRRLELHPFSQKHKNVTFSLGSDQKRDKTNFLKEMKTRNVPFLMKRWTIIHYRGLKQTEDRGGFTQKTEGKPFLLVYLSHSIKTLIKTTIMAVLGS